MAVKKPTGDLKKACWKGYTAVGMKMKNGRKVPNCVPVSEEECPVRRHYKELKKLPIKDLRDRIKQSSRVIDVSGFDKESAISHILRRQHGDKRVNQAFGLDEEADYIAEDAKRDKVSADLHKQGIGSHWRNPQVLVVHDKHKKKVQQYMDKVTGGWVHVAGHSEESINEETGDVQHLIGITVSHPELKSAEPIFKKARVRASSEEEAIKKVKSHYRKAGYKVHDAFHHSTLTFKRKVDEETGRNATDAENKKALDTLIKRSDFKKTVRSLKKRDQDGEYDAKQNQEFKNRLAKLRERSEQVDEARRSDDPDYDKSQARFKKGLPPTKGKPPYKEDSYWAKRKKQGTMEEAATSDNTGYGKGYHGNIGGDDKKYSSMHTKVKGLVGAAGHLSDVKKPNVMVKHFLDSTHGRHIADQPSDSNITSRFKKFKNTYNPEMHEEFEQMEEAHKIGSKVKIVKGSGKGIEGVVGEIRHGAYKGAPKTYTVFHGAHDAIQVPKEHMRAMKEEAEQADEGYVKSANKKLKRATIGAMGSDVGKATGDTWQQKRDSLLRLARAKLKEESNQMDEEVKQIEEGPQRDTTRAMNKLRDAIAGANYRKSGMPAPGLDAKRKTPQALNKAIGRDLRKMGEAAEQIEENNLGLRSLVSTDSKKQPFYKTQKGRDAAAKKNIPALKSAIKSSLGKHPKPNLPEAAESYAEYKAKHSTQLDIERKVKDHNNTVEKMSRKSSRDIDYTHPKVLKKAPNGYFFSTSGQLHMKEEVMAPQGDEPTPSHYNIVHRDSKRVVGTATTIKRARSARDRHDNKYGSYAHSIVPVFKEEFEQMDEKHLTPAERKKREEIAQAMERKNPGMDMGKKMAIATAQAKKVAEGYGPKRYGSREDDFGHEAPDKDHVHSEPKDHGLTVHNHEGKEIGTVQKNHPEPMTVAMNIAMKHSHATGENTEVRRFGKKVQSFKGKKVNEQGQIDELNQYQDRAAAARAMAKSKIPGTIVPHPRGGFRIKHVDRGLHIMREANHTKTIIREVIRKAVDKQGTNKANGKTVTGAPAAKVQINPSIDLGPNKRGIGGT